MVVGGGAVPRPDPAFLTQVFHTRAFLFMEVHADGRHQAVALGKPVTGDFQIHVQGKKAVGTMIAARTLLQRFHGFSAFPVLAGKAFIDFDHFHTFVSL